MCGFVYAPGYARMTTTQKGQCDRALNAISHRGIRNNVRINRCGYFGHVRLPIVDKSSELDHPRSGPKPWYGMFVGEVFNFKDYGDFDLDLDALLYVFVTQGWGGFHSFDGFWAGVISHLEKTDTYVFVDYLAQKPVYWRSDVDVYASEPIALLQFGPLPLNRAYIARAIKFGYDPFGETPWEGIKALEPGSYSYVRDGSTVKHSMSYWNWKLVPTSTINLDLTVATKRRVLGGQYPVAVLLSGGLDSTIVARLAAMAKPDLTVFHVDNEEAEYAEMVPLPAAATRVKVPDEGEPWYSMAIAANQSPVDLGSVGPQHQLSRALQKAEFHVALSGDGADELFGGYSRSKHYDSQSHDVFLELPFYHLRRLDAIMMRGTIELRTPFLSAPVIAGALQLPWEKRMGKNFLKEEFAGLVPNEILNRPKLPLRSPTYKHDSVEHRVEVLKIFEQVFNRYIRR